MQLKIITYSLYIDNKWTIEYIDESIVRLYELPIEFECIGNTRDVSPINSLKSAGQYLAADWNFEVYPYCPIRCNGKWGFVDNQLKIVCNCIFDDVGYEVETHCGGCWRPTEFYHYVEWSKNNRCPITFNNEPFEIDKDLNLYTLDNKFIRSYLYYNNTSDEYKTKLRELPKVTLDAISELCRGMLPSEYRSHPWDLPYGDKNFAKIFDQEDQLNGYAAAYTNWHKGKLRIAFDHMPTDTFVGEIAVIDWACGQGLATIFLHEYLEEKGYNCRIKEVILIEPSEKALDRAKFNIEAIDSKITVSTVNNYYFNSKYAREDYKTEFGEPFSLTHDTDHGKYSSFDVLFKYLRVVDDDVMGPSDSQIGNIKHLHGAVRLIRRSLTDTNPALDMLNSYCLLFLGVGDNKNLVNEMRNSYISAYKEFRERSIHNFPDFYANMKRFKEEIQKKGRNVVDAKEMLLIKGWEAEAELIIHSSWVKMFRDKFVGVTKDNVQSSKNKK